MTDQPQPKHLAVPIELAQKLAGYLQQHPYAQVAGLIAELQKCQPVTLQEPPIDRSVGE